jgi:hypothetical protein
VAIPNASTSIVEPVDDLRELLHLLRGEEVRLVADEVVDAPTSLVRAG